MWFSCLSVRSSAPRRCLLAAASSSEPPAPPSPAPPRSTWLLVLNYGYCFGVELTVDNNISPYLYDQFGIDLHLAGAQL